LCQHRLALLLLLLLLSPRLAARGAQPARREVQQARLDALLLLPAPLLVLLLVALLAPLALAALVG
jgi:hypothetical protein